MNERVIALVIGAVQEIGREQNVDVLKKADIDTTLFGSNLDSINTVLLISNLEEKVADEFNTHVSLADERAMSLKTSPFLSVKTLARYIDRLLTESRNE